MEVVLKNLPSNAYECTLLGLKDTQKLAVKIAKDLLKDGPSVVALYGDLGAGKTTFVQFLAKALGIKDEVLSPTFVIIKNFNMANGKHMIHVDTYRLKTVRGLLNLGLKDLLKDKENILVIEWPEKIEKLLPKNTLRIYFSVINEKERKVILK